MYDQLHIVRIVNKTLFKIIVTQGIEPSLQPNKEIVQVTLLTKPSA